ncbi:MAG: citramalate synthase [Chloroflexi bacterium]|nr:citramalate synthase [Chloroflexota bacterium]
MESIQLYDTTLRDGAQQEGISLSVEDKLKITRKLDELGVTFIEGGWPGSNPKDVEYFQRVRSMPLRHAIIAAFGSTRRAGIPAQRDANLIALIESGAPVLTLVGKSWDLHVTRVLETSLEENLAMIADSVAYLRGHGRRVFFDAEHFFDGFKANQQYTLECLRSAAKAGAEALVLCDTNGGTLPHQVQEVVSQVRKELDAPLGIHAHNDCEVAVANSLAAVQAGVTHVQGTINGYGERCGNANLLSVVANLHLKLGIPCLAEEQLARLTEVHRYVSEVVNLPPSNTQPFVGNSAFSHKGGLHGSAVIKLEESYQHIKPALVGNSTRMLVSELAGRGNITYKLRELGLGTAVLPEQAAALVAEIKAKESQGYQYEGADASFELLVRRAIQGHTPTFELVDYMVIVERRRRPSNHAGSEELLSEATVKIKVRNELRHTAAVGNGPVNALDSALRKALLHDYPSLASVRLVDYKVRVVDQGSGTAATVRVLIESTDGTHTWQTVGSSTNIIEASWLAVMDSLEYWLLKYR